jgi:hypothetical protein
VKSRSVTNLLLPETQQINKPCGSSLTVVLSEIPFAVGCILIRLSSLSPWLFFTTFLSPTAMRSSTGLNGEPGRLTPAGERGGEFRRLSAGAGNTVSSIFRRRLGGAAVEESVSGSGDMELAPKPY